MPRIRSTSTSRSKLRRANGVGRLLRVLEFAVAIQLLVASSIAAQAWFGQMLPGPASDGIVPALDTVHTDIAAHPAAFGPGPKDPGMAGRRMKEDLRTIVGFSLKSRANGDFLWGRISGMPAYYDTAKWAV
jgi:hypothetical protein